MDRGSINRAFGEELRVRRKETGRTVEEMRKALHWRLGTYKNTEKGDRDVSLTDIFDVAAILNVSPTTIFVATRKRWLTNDYPDPSPTDEWHDLIGW